MTKAKICGAVFSLFLLAAGAARAVPPKLQEAFGIQQYFHKATSATGTMTISGMARSWSVRAAGGSVSFTIAHSTGTSFAVNTSSTIVVLSGEAVADINPGIMINPIFEITSITTPGATAYVDISYLSPREAGGVY